MNHTKFAWTPTKVRVLWYDTKDDSYILTDTYKKVWLRDYRIATYTNERLRGKRIITDFMADRYEEYSYERQMKHKEPYIIEFKDLSSYDYE